MAVGNTPFRPTDKSYDLIANSYKVFPGRDQTAQIKEKLTEKAINVAIKTLDWNQQNKKNDIIMTFSKLLLNCTTERQGQNLFLDQLLKWQLKVFWDQQEKLMRKIEKETIKFMCSCDR